MSSSSSAVVPAPPTPKTGQKIKIGNVARRFKISVDLLRLYEREGLLIPIKSPKGTRYYTPRDYPWIETLLHLVRSAGLNFAGIRHLLAVLPCWELRQCPSEQKEQCAATVESSNPCWVGHNCCWPGRDCYECTIYRSAPACANMKSFLLTGKEQLVLAGKDQGKNT